MCLQNTLTTKLTVLFASSTVKAYLLNGHPKDVQARQELPNGSKEAT